MSVDKPLEGEVLHANYTTTIAEYSPTTATLKVLDEKYRDKKYECTTTAGMTAAIAARREIRDTRVGLEHERVRIKAPALQRARDIDTEAKRITKVLEDLEEPIDAQIKAEETRKDQIKAEAAEKERARVQGLQDAIQKIRDLPLSASGKTSAEIAEIIARAKVLVISDEYQELQLTAQNARETSIRALEQLYADTLGREREAEKLAADRAELDRLRAEQDRIGAIQKKLDRLKMAYLDVVGGTAQSISEFITRYQQVAIDESYQEFVLEAQSLIATGIEQLTRMHADAMERENREAETQKDRERIESAAKTERERIADIQSKLDALRPSIDVTRMQAVDIQFMQSQFASMTIDSRIYQEYTEQALRIFKTSVAMIDTLYANAVEREEREAKEKADKEEADRQERERTAKQAEDDRKKAQEEAEKREAAEREKQEADRKLKLSEAKRESAEAALGEIFTLVARYNDGPLTHESCEDILKHIGLIAEANLAPKIPNEKKVRKTRQRTELRTT